jgi:hypothetical protein
MVELGEFTIEEIIEHLEWEADNITLHEFKKLKEIVKDVDEVFSEKTLAENYLYQKILSLECAIDRWKLDIILENLHKHTYNEICEFFENK